MKHYLPANCALLLATALASAPGSAQDANNAVATQAGTGNRALIGQANNGEGVLSGPQLLKNIRQAQFHRPIDHQPHGDRKSVV